MATRHWGILGDKFDIAMLILPYSSTLNLAHRPIVTYVMMGLCTAVFLLQMSSNLTGSLVYWSDSWNPLTMISSSLAHAGPLHLLGNLIFFFAFAPALEIVIANTRQYLSCMLLIVVVTSVLYSLFLLGADPPRASLGFSGVVAGMMGLSAYLMPRARIKVFFWYWIAWKTFAVQSWVVAAYFIGFDVWVMFSDSPFASGINLIAHVFGAATGYLFGYIWLKERRKEVAEELEEELKAVDVGIKHGKERESTYRHNKVLDERQAAKEATRNYDRFMNDLYRQVNSNRDSEAIALMLSRFDDHTPIQELEAAFQRISEWGPSRTLLCLGRMIIDRLDYEKRYGRAIAFIEKCQAVSPGFLLPDMNRTRFYEQTCRDAGRTEAAKNLRLNNEFTLPSSGVTWD